MDESDGRNERQHCENLDEIHGVDENDAGRNDVDNNNTSQTIQAEGDEYNSVVATTTNMATNCEAETNNAITSAAEFGFLSTSIDGGDLSGEYDFDDVNEEAYQALQAVDAVTTKSDQFRPRLDNTMSFPQRLMAILSDPSTSSAITWLPHGRAFKVIDKTRFVNEVLLTYFGAATKYTSFTRKLNRWNFTRVTRGDEVGSYFHPKFQRDESELCNTMECLPTGMPQALTAMDPIALGIASFQQNTQPPSQSQAFLRQWQKMRETEQIYQGSKDMRKIKSSTVSNQTDQIPQPPPPLMQYQQQQQPQPLQQQQQQLQQYPPNFFLQAMQSQLQGLVASMPPQQQQQVMNTFYSNHAPVSSDNAASSKSSMVAASLDMAALYQQFMPHVLNNDGSSSSNNNTDVSSFASNTNAFSFQPNINTTSQQGYEQSMGHTDSKTFYNNDGDDQKPGARNDQQIPQAFNDLLIENDNMLQFQERMMDSYEQSYGESTNSAMGLSNEQHHGPSPIFFDSISNNNSNSNNTEAAVAHTSTVSEQQSDTSSHTPVNGNSNNGGSCFQQQRYQRPRG